MDAIINNLVTWLSGIFNGNAYLTTIFVSMVPMVETRGAIPIATSLGIPQGIAFLVAALSALIVCPILLLVLRPILNALKKTKLFKKIAERVEAMFLGKAQGIENKADKKQTAEEEKRAGRKKIFWTAFGVFAFVAIPLPMTGVWTGSAIAAFINLKYRYSVPAIVLGNFTAASIITILDIVLKEYSWIILVVLAGFMVITIVSLLVTLFVKSKKKLAAPLPELGGEVTRNESNQAEDEEDNSNIYR